jgi:hypothetical protein
VRDSNGSDFGSIAFAALPATHGTATLNSASLGMYPTMNHVVRVLALRGGAVVGAASGVSTAVMDGIRPADGGLLTNGYAINNHGTDGFLTSDQATASGQILGSVETFDQATNAITATVASTDHVYGTLLGGCPGLFHGDVGLYDESTPAADTFWVLNPVATGSSREPGRRRPRSRTACSARLRTRRPTTPRYWRDPAAQVPPIASSPAMSGRTRSGPTAASRRPWPRWASRSPAA